MTKTFVELNLSILSAAGFTDEEIRMVSPEPVVITLDANGPPTIRYTRQSMVRGLELPGLEESPSLSVKRVNAKVVPTEVLRNELVDLLAAEVKGDPGFAARVFTVLEEAGLAAPTVTLGEDNGGHDTEGTADPETPVC